ncbi:hypothetical protein D3C76_1698490 [compost metagenome]
MSRMQIVVDIFKKWNDPNTGATTQELRVLKDSLEKILDEVIQTIETREKNKE